jgi:hypothetical protein
VRRTAHRDRFDRQHPRTTVAAGTEPRPARRRLYVPVTAKFVTAQMLVAGWLGVSLWLSLPWVRELAAATSTVPAIVVVSLVAQGAFSLPEPGAASGGWLVRRHWRGHRPALEAHAAGARVYYEPSAVAFTAAPARLVHLARRRARWARGMIEGIRSVKPWSQPRRLLRFLAAIACSSPHWTSPTHWCGFPASPWRSPAASSCPDRRDRLRPGTPGAPPLEMIPGESHPVTASGPPRRIDPSQGGGRH